MPSLQCRTVHYHLDKSECRPAQVVKEWSKTTLNLVVVLDGSNDKYHGEDGSLLAWKTSVEHGTAIGTWHDWGECPYQREVNTEGGDPLSSYISS